LFRAENLKTSVGYLPESNNQILNVPSVSQISILEQFVWYVRYEAYELYE